MSGNTLRGIAELRLLKKTAPGEESGALPEVLHDLRIQQIELELQNEELRQASQTLEAARDRYVDLYEFAPLGYLTLGDDGLINRVNLAGAEMLGVIRGKLLDRRFADFVVPQDRQRWQLRFRELMAGGRGGRHLLTLELQRANRWVLHAHLECRRREAEGAPPMLRLAIVDITELGRARTEPRGSGGALESQVGMLITDAQAAILSVNPAFSAITGYSALDAIGRNPRMLGSGRQGADFYATMWRSLQRTGAWEGQLWNARKSGESYPQHLAITAVTDAAGAVTNYVGLLTDVSATRDAAEELLHLAFYDLLTHLPNRRLLLDRLGLALSECRLSGRQGALLLIDLDNFRTLNESLGYEAGDLLLQEVAQRLEATVREGDTVARLGGDEFVVMLEDLSHDANEAVAQVRVVAAKLLAALHQPHHLAPGAYQSSASIGATLFSEQRRADLLKQADIAMYQAKSAGRNTVRFFDSTMQACIDDRMALDAELRVALAEGQFTLHFQAQTQRQAGITGAEVLVRWCHPRRGMVQPGHFIQMAEENGLIVPLGLWVLGAACAQLKHWASTDEFRHLELAVNVSARQFHQDDFVEQVRRVLAESAADPQRLKLELTESVIITDIQGTIAKMNLLRSVGVRFSMDDFGIGHSSLSSLRRLPLDQLKIDHSFVQEVANDPEDAVMVQTIISMARNLDIDVIAEGVETEAQRAFLELHGCDACQGYLFGRPVPVEAFEALVATSPPARWSANGLGAQSASGPS
jgi:diguanylate cyclase (GGDEF)-like protein/PAS domain S-box-containing protein